MGKVCQVVECLVFKPRLSDALRNVKKPFGILMATFWQGNSETVRFSDGSVFRVHINWMVTVLD